MSPYSRVSWGEEMGLVGFWHDHFDHLADIGAGRFCIVRGRLTVDQTRIKRHLARDSQIEIVECQSPGGHARGGGNDRRRRMARAAKIKIVDRQRATTTVASRYDHRSLCGRQHHSIANRIATGVQEIEINTNTVRDEDIIVTRFAAPGVADTGPVADRNKTIDTVLRGLVGADAVVAAFNRPDILKNDVATISVNVESIILGVRGRDIADDEMGIVAAKLHASRADREPDVGLLKRFPRLKFDKE